jgi:hypothetical protein
VIRQQVFRVPALAGGFFVTQSISTAKPTQQALAPPSRLRHALNLAFIALAVVFLFWRVFFLGETVIDVQTLNNQLPWGYSAGESSYPYDRRDLTDMYVTREYFAAAAYRDRELPLWNPYTMAGHPIYADGVTRVFSPFQLVYAFLDLPLGYSVVCIVQLLLGAMFMYAFLIGAGAGPEGGLMGALVFAFSSHSMLHLTGLGWWGGLMWLPLILLFVDRAVTRNDFTQAIVAGIFLALQFFCGYLPIEIYFVGAIVLYYVFLRGAGGHLPRRLSMMAVTLGVGFALAATQWVPVMELLKYSNRRIVPTEIGYIYLPPWYAATLIFPNIFGTAYDAKALTLFTALRVSHDHILYIGIVALLPLAFCLWWFASKRGWANWIGVIGRRRLNDNGSTSVQLSAAPIREDRVLCLALLMVISLVLMMASPLYVHVTRFIPVLQTIRVTVRAGVLFLFAASGLTGIGVPLLLAADRAVLARVYRGARSFSLAVGALVLALIAVSYAIKKAGFSLESAEHGRVAFVKRAAALLSEQFTPPGSRILISVALLAAVAVALWMAASAKITRKSFYTVLIVVLMGDLFWNAVGANPAYDSARVFQHTQMTGLIASLPPGRVLVTPSDIDLNRRAEEIAGREKIIAPPNTLLPYRIATVTGKDQLFPKRYRDFCSLIEPQPNPSHVVFDKNASHFFDLLNVKYILTRASNVAPPGADLLGTAEGLSLYENKSGLPRAFFAKEVLVVKDQAEAFARMKESDFAPASAVVIESPAPVPGIGPAAAAAGEAQAWLTEDKRNRVTVETDDPTDGLLVLADNYYPGWRAEVDGARTEILRADVALRAVRVPAGHHVVSFIFAPRSLTLSFYVSLCAGAIVLALLILIAVRSKKPGTPVSPQGGGMK